MLPRHFESRSQNHGQAVHTDSKLFSQTPRAAGRRGDGGSRSSCIMLHWVSLQRMNRRLRFMGPQYAGGPLVGPQKGFRLQKSPLPHFSQAVAAIVANGGTRTQTPGGWCSAQRGRASLHGSSCGTRCGETINAQIRPRWSSVTER